MASQEQQHQLKPQFFVTRQNGAMVPLIAMDELPIHVQIHGVSRNLSAFEIAGMTGVGVAEARHQFYTVKSINNTKPLPVSPPGAAPESAPESAPVSATSEASTPALKTTGLAILETPQTSNKDTDTDTDTSSNSRPPPTASVDVENKATTIKSSSNTTTRDTNAQSSTADIVPPPLAWRRSTIKASVDTNTTLPPSLNGTFTDKTHPEVDWDPEMPPAGHKIYCSHWLKYGECSFTQTGCLYKHVMPLKLEVLEVLGLRDLPDWFRKAVSCGSLRVNNGRNGLSFGITPPNHAVGAVGAGMPAAGNNARNAPRTRVDTEASRRAIAAHINSIPLDARGGRPNRNASRFSPRPTSNIPVAPTAAERAKQLERRDQRMAAAFDADLESNACTDMMDDEMLKIREREQAGWEEEQKARLAAVESGRSVRKSARRSTESAGRRRRVQKE